MISFGRQYVIQRSSLFMPTPLFHPYTTTPELHVSGLPIFLLPSYLPLMDLYISQFQTILFPQKEHNQLCQLKTFLSTIRATMERGCSEVSVHFQLALHTEQFVSHALLLPSFVSSYIGPPMQPQVHADEEILLGTTWWMGHQVVLLPWAFWCCL